MGGISWGAVIAAVISGIIIADILTHGPGTAAAANGAATVLKPTYNALLGVPSTS
jgi:hypothetical protein